MYLLTFLLNTYIAQVNIKELMYNFDHDLNL